MEDYDWMKNMDKNIIKVELIEIKYNTVWHLKRGSVVGSNTLLSFSPEEDAKTLPQVFATDLRHLTVTDPTYYLNNFILKTGWKWNFGPEGVGGGARVPSTL